MAWQKEIETFSSADFKLKKRRTVALAFTMRMCALFAHFSIFVSSRLCSLSLTEWVFNITNVFLIELCRRQYFLEFFMVFSLELFLFVLQ